MSERAPANANANATDVVSAFDPELRQAQKDWSDYLGSRDTQDARGAIHSAQDGKSKSNPNEMNEDQYFDHQLDSSAADAEKEYGLAGKGLKELAEVIRDAKARGDKTTEMDAREIFDDKFIAVAEKYGWEGVVKNRDGKTDDRNKIADARLAYYEGIMNGGEQAAAEKLPSIADLESDDPITISQQVIDQVNALRARKGKLTPDEQKTLSAAEKILSNIASGDEQANEPKKTITPYADRPDGEKAETGAKQADTIPLEPEAPHDVTTVLPTDNKSDIDNSIDTTGNSATPTIPAPPTEATPATLPDETSKKTPERGHTFTQRIKKIGAHLIRRFWPPKDGKKETPSRYPLTDADHTSLDALFERQNNPKIAVRERASSYHGPEKSEDVTLRCPLENGGIFGVYDGLGGTKGDSSEAGRIIAGEMEARLAIVDAGISDEDFVFTLENTQWHARQAAYNHNFGSHIDTVGTTVRVLEENGSDDIRLGIIHVGDTALFLLHDGKMERLTPEQIDEHQPNVVTNAYSPRWDADLSDYIKVVHAHRGDMIVLCSDGITGDYPSQKLLPEEMRDIALSNTADDAADKLMQYGQRKDDDKAVVVVQL